MLRLQEILPKMQASICDVKTGEIYRCKADVSPYMWTMGNWSCDCNRNEGHPQQDTVDDELEQAQLEEFPELRLPQNAHQSYCYGCQRFVVVAICGDLDGWISADAVLSECNTAYPPDIVAQAMTGYRQQQGQVYAGD